MVDANIIILGLLVILSAFFSGAEVALVSMSEIKVKTLLKKRRKGAETLYRLKQDPQKMIITILIGNNIVNISSASLATLVAIEAFGSSGIGIATGVMTLVVLTFGEIIPKTFANTHKEKVSLIIARPIEILSYILYPLVVFFSWFAAATNKVVRVKKHESITEAEMRTMLEFGLEEKIIEPEEKYIMEQAFKFADVSAFDIMTPSKEMLSLSSGSTVKSSIERILKSGHSRIPIYTRNKKHITGIVFIKDLFDAVRERKGKKKLRELALDPIFIQKDTVIGDLLKVFQRKHTHIAIVTDKKKMLGIVTLEDLIEELVGEITDESDVTPDTIIRIHKNVIIAHGNTSVKEINTFFNISLPVKRKNIQLYELILQHVKKPKSGTRLKIGNIRMTLEDVRDNEILKVRLIKKNIVRNTKRKRK